GLRLDAAYNSFDVKSELLSDAGVDNASGNVRVLGFTGNLVFPIPLQAVMVRPYLIGGIGLYNVRASATIRDQGNSTSDSMSENKFGFNLGGGVSIPLSGFNTFIEARYHRVNMQDGSFAYVPITVGVMF
ncbi:MAG: outer membrane protein, partial [Gemmatimonadaceae bacterium]